MARSPVGKTFSGSAPRSHAAKLVRPNRTATQDRRQIHRRRRKRAGKHPLWLGTSRDGYQVLDREPTHTNGVSHEILRAAIATIQLKGISCEAFEVDMGRYVGLDYWVPVSPGDTIVWKRKPGRVTRVRCVENNAPPTETHYVTVVIERVHNRLIMKSARLGRIHQFRPNGQLWAIRADVVEGTIIGKPKIARPRGKSQPERARIRMVA